MKASKSIYINGFTREKVLAQIKEKNGFEKSEKMVEDPFGPEIQQCSYRGDDGRACLMGVFLPDKYYRTSLEGASSNAILGLVEDRKDTHDPGCSYRDKP